VADQTDAETQITDVVSLLLGCGYLMGKIHSANNMLYNRLD
jgi:hypothetical protein